LHMIPLAALAAMLVYTGFRLAHPTEFVNVFRIGREQLAIFLTTIIAVLATDLLIGVAAGIALKMIFHIANGVPLRSLFKPYLEVKDIDDTTSMIIARDSAVFSNWIPFRRQIEQIGLLQHRNMIIDVSNAQIVDHSVMEKLEEMERDFELEGLTFEVRGLEMLQPFTDNVHAARKRGLATIRRVTVVADESLEKELTEKFVELGATGFTTMECSGVGRTKLEHGLPTSNSQVRIEVIVSQPTCDAILAFLREQVSSQYPMTTVVENVDVIRRDDFVSTAESSKEHEVIES